MYIFSYAALHKKNVTVYLFSSVPSSLPDDFIHLKALCSKKNIRFLLHTNSLYFIFFINYNGIIEYLICSKHKINSFSDFKEDVLRITNDNEYNFFDIQTKKYFLKENNIKQTVHILKKALYERNI